MLALCEACNRHVRGATCPFCGSAVAPSARAPRPRTARAGRLVAVAAIGVACGGTTSPADGGATDAADDFAAQPMYGAVIPDAGFDAPTDAPTDAADASDADDADATGIALYGAPPPPEGGV